jgi:hypothetical protein
MKYQQMLFDSGGRDIKCGTPGVSQGFNGHILTFWDQDILDTSCGHITCGEFLKGSRTSFLDILNTGSLNRNLEFQETRCNHDQPCNQ